MNLLHDIEPGTKESINAIIEVPKDSHNKYEIIKENGLIRLDRANYSAAAYPFDYGFIPQTLWDDHDALDVIVLTTYPINVGVLVEVRPVGVLHMIDSGDKDEKIITVPIHDNRWEKVRELEDVNPYTLREIIDFFETYKKLKVKGKGANVEVGEFGGRIEAEEAFDRACKMYAEAQSVKGK